MGAARSGPSPVMHRLPTHASSSDLRKAQQVLLEIRPEAVAEKAKGISSRGHVGTRANQALGFFGRDFVSQAQGHHGVDLASSPAPLRGREPYHSRRNAAYLSRKAARRRVRLPRCPLALPASAAKIASRRTRRSRMGKPRPCKQAYPLARRFASRFAGPS